MREIHIGMFKQIQSDIFYCLTNRFHVAVRLLSNRSQMMSKCGKNKEVDFVIKTFVIIGFDCITNERFSLTHAIVNYMKKNLGITNLVTANLSVELFQRLMALGYFLCSVCMEIQ